MSELDHITVLMGLAAYSSSKPRYHIWKLARRYKKSTKNPDVKRIMNKILKDANPVDTVTEVIDEFLLKTK